MESKGNCATYYYYLKLLVIGYIIFAGNITCV